MSDTERWGTRDLTYSNWHRVPSIGRFLGADVARTLTMIDLDGLEYCHRCDECVGVVEVARDIGQSFKASSVTRKLALRLGVPGLLVFYSTSATRQIGDHQDIDEFRVRVIAPRKELERRLTPEQYARWLAHMHSRCACRLAEAA
jgi:hypothetical protein